MKEEPNSSFALPLTFGGVAEFAQAPRSRLFVFQLVVALLAVGVVAAFFEIAWVPAINRAIQALPPKGAIQDGTLNWTAPSPLRSIGTSFLWITVDPADLAEANEGADVQFEFGRHELRLRSFLGYLALPYPHGFVIGLNRNQAEPWWGAWHPAVTVGLGVVVFGQLFVIWALLAFVYAWPVRLIALYADRPLTMVGAWRLASAALMPGALFLIAAIFAYAFHHLNLVQFLAAAVLHLMIGWVYTLSAPFCLPQRGGPVDQVSNPFKNTPPEPKKKNPFANDSKKR